MLQVSSSAVPVPTGISEEAAQQYRELYEKFMALQGEIQQLRSDKIILDNSATQLKFNLDTEREKLSATELVCCLMLFRMLKIPKFIWFSDNFNQLVIIT